MTPATVRFSVDAVRDLESMYRFIAPRAGEKVARDFAARLHAYCVSLGAYPMRGIARDDLRPGLRVVGYRRQATIALAFDGSTVTILRIFGRRQDVLASLEEK